MITDSTYTLTLEKALTDTFVLALQQEMQSALVVTAAENFGTMTLPACFVKCTRQRESMIDSAIFQFSVDIALIVQADDMDQMAMENLWSQVLCVSHDITGLKAKLNAVRPQYAFVLASFAMGQFPFRQTSGTLNALSRSPFTPRFSQVDNLGKICPQP